MKGVLLAGVTSFLDSHFSFQRGTFWDNLLILWMNYSVLGISRINKVHLKARSSLSRHGPVPCGFKPVRIHELANSCAAVSGVIRLQRKISCANGTSSECGLDYLYPSFSLKSCVCFFSDRKHCKLKYKHERKRSAEHVSASRRTLAGFLALAGRSRSDLESRSLIAAQRGRFTTSSEAEAFGKGKRPPRSRWSPGGPSGGGGPEWRRGGP